MSHASIFNGLFSFSPIDSLCPFWGARTTNTGADEGVALGGASVDVDSVNLMQTFVGCEDGGRGGHPVSTGRPPTQDILLR